MVTGWNPSGPPTSPTSFVEQRPQAGRTGVGLDLAVPTADLGQDLVDAGVDGARQLDGEAPPAHRVEQLLVRAAERLGRIAHDEPPLDGGVVGPRRDRGAERCTHRHLVADLEARAPPVGHQVDDGGDVVTGGQHHAVARMLLLEGNQQAARASSWVSAAPATGATQRHERGAEAVGAPHRVPAQPSPGR